jgi:hypothetical protein
MASDRSSNVILEIWNKLSLKEMIELAERFNIQTMQAIWENKKLVEYLIKNKKLRLIRR